MKCPNCDGKGFNTIYENNQSYIEDCEMCNGTGELRNSKTNKDKLMEMSNEEIAKGVTDSCCFCVNKDVCEGEVWRDCEAGIKEWLEAYVED